MSDTLSDKEIEEIYEQIEDSFMLSMKHEGIDEETRNEVVTTVRDNIGNFL